MERAPHAHLPKAVETPTYGGTSFWIRGPEGLDGQALAAQALERGIVLEPGDICFAGATPPLNHFRLGFSSIPLKRTEPGIKLLAELVHATAGRTPITMPPTQIGSAACTERVRQYRAILVVPATLQKTPH